jgi:hypothetical protein
MASVEDVQPVDTMWLSPRNPNRMETSLASVPMVPVGMVYTLHWAFRCRSGWLETEALECLAKGPFRPVFVEQNSA